MRYVKTVSDPVHGSIQLTELEVEIIQSQTFQRLRGVKQLGLAEYVFPGANYSRLSHMIGVCHVAGRMSQALRDAGADLPDDDVQLLRVAGLLHDVGHYPFSHAMERAVKSAYQASQLEEMLAPDQPLMTREHAAPPSERTSEGAARGERSILNHEQLGCEIIMNQQSEINSLLSSRGIDPSELERIIGHHVQAHRCASIISSDLDADRVDYLMRTAHFAGLPYGKIDLDYLLTSMTLDDSGHPAIRPRALRTAEDVLLARYFDYQQVSFHHTTVAFETVLEQVLEYLMRTESIRCDGATMSERVVNPDSWVCFDDAEVLGQIRALAQDGSGSLESRLAKSIVERRPPKLVWNDDRFGDWVHEEVLKERWGRLKTVVSEMCEAFDIPREFAWPTKKQVRLSSFKSALRPEADPYEPSTVVRIAESGGAYTPISDRQDSIMNVLKNNYHTSIRLYVFLEGDLIGRRDEVEDFISGRMTKGEW